ncbi:E3 ubiquitin-protein ligase HECTD1-like [Clytia hemisphaerica]|uniref:E3 ubiquitin-protein ligase n=1 Tax=Clytia hemisphaerica TaxID=252671 RepID=A0A7M5VEK6_9CNID
MADIDPDTLLEWLTMGAGDERDMQVIALEQLCMLLLMSDNVDRCFESCPPRSFLPALCHIFMDETAPDSILEVTARAITYYLDVSAECSRRIVTVDGAVKALCTRLVVVDITSRTSKDLAEQCVKVLELMCTREAGSIYEAGGLNCMVTFIREYGSQIHKDTLHSAMSVVARLCSKIEPTDETLEDCMDSLSKLLQHQDNNVADTALKCFACVADRFTRRGVDPAPLAKHGLTDELLKKLVSSAMACGNNASTSMNASLNESRSSSGNVSIIVSVLSMLCRGSPTITHDLLRSNLPDAIETAMNGDERCVLDTMRLVDLLLILLFEGRGALPKSASSSRASLGNLRKLDSTGDKSHRQLIDCIRSKDTDALIEAVDSSQFDVNFMDDVGQTLLNWASAFGTLEMVEFLCDRGADVNRGQRSSSLHYAACFGRPAVAKVLLRHGANPELRDEDGKTPLDKARERNDEGHKEVVRILQSPGEWLTIVAMDTTDTEASNTEQETKPDDTTTTDQPEEGSTETPTESEIGDQDQDKEITESPEKAVKGDPEVAPIYIKRLVPVFANTFQSSLIPSVKKATLSILKKMIHSIPAQMMEEVISGTVASQLVDVIAVALNVEDDDEGHLAVFNCVQDMMTKGPNIFLIHFIRLGVLQKISEMASQFEIVDQDVIIDGKIQEKEEQTIPLEDATKVLAGLPYHWHDWCLVRGRDCLYLWSDFCAIELSNGSNGWFRFVLDGKLLTMYSSGSPEGGSSSNESRTEFLEKLQRARASVPSSAVSQPILSALGGETLIVGNWTLSCKQEHQLHVINTDGQQATILKEDLPGFLFESNRGTKHTFTAEISLGPDFAFSWSGKQGKKFQSRKDQVRQKLSSLANSIYCKYFKDADLTPHGSMATLIQISKTLNDCVNPNEPLLPENKDKLYSALTELCNIVTNETMLSSYEIQTSGLVTALNNCLNKTLPLSSSLTLSKEQNYPKEAFKKVFGDQSKIDAESGGPAITLVRKLIMVLESSEKLPVLAYESSGTGTGLQVLLKRLRFKLERGGRSSDFINRSGKNLKMEPLTTVGEIEAYLLKMVEKKWYDYERSSFKFVKHFKENADQHKTFEHQSDFDQNGIIYWLGTNANETTDWINPARHNVVLISSSEGRSLPYGRLEDIINRDSAPVNCHTNDNKSAWFTLDIGVNVIPSAYTLRHARGYGRSAIRNWLFQASKDATTWTTLKTHENDESLQDPGSTHTWKFSTEEIGEETEGWHYFRIQQNGTNASGQTYYLSLSGFEIYGKVTSAVEQMKPLATPEADNTQKKQRRIFRSQILRHMALSAKEGSDWKLLHNQSRAKAANTTDAKNDTWVDVSWAQNMASKTNEDGDSSNVKVVNIADPSVAEVMLKAERMDKNASNKSHDAPSPALDNNLKQVVMSFGKKKDGEKSDSENNKDNTNEADKQGETRIDLANLQFLMAVEDLLDNSELVANALAEAASIRVDQVRMATQSFKNTLVASNGKNRPTPSAQGSRESQSPPNELSVPVTSEPTLAVSVESKDEDKDQDGSESPQPDTESTPLTKEECLDTMQKISSSMSDVLDTMNIEPSTKETAQQENEDTQEGELSDDSQSSAAVNVAENNFLNDNHSAGLQASYIAMMKEANDRHDNEPMDEDDDDDDYDEDEFEDYDDVTADVTKVEECVIDTTVATEQSTSAQNKDNSSTDTKESSEKTSDSVSNVVDTASGNTTTQAGISRDVLASMLQVLTGNNDSVENIDDITQQALRLLSGGTPSENKKDETKEEDSTEKSDRESPVSKTPENVESDVKDTSAETSKDDSSVKKGSSTTDVPSTSIEGESSEGDSLSTMKTPERIIDDEGDSDMYTLEEILQFHKLSKLVAEKEKKLVTKEGEEGNSTEEGSNKKESVDEPSSSTKKQSISETTTTSTPMYDDDDDDEDDDDDDDDYDDIENEEEDHDPDEMYEPLQVHRHDYPGEHHRRMWNDELVLKCQHDALVPAFDPRPGRTNVQQTQDIEIPTAGTQKENKKEKVERKIRLFLRGTPYVGAKEIEIPLDNTESTIFSYVQSLVLYNSSSNQSDRLRRVWDPNFVLVYKSTKESGEEDSTVLREEDVVKWGVSFVKDNIGTVDLPKSDLINYLQQNCNEEFLKKWRLVGTTRSCRKQRNCSSLSSAYKEFTSMKMEEAANKPKEVKEKVVKIEEPLHRHLEGVTPIQQVLEVINSLHRISDEVDDTVSFDDEKEVFYVPNDEFLCKKITNKLVQQIQDPLTLASGSLPLWCEYLVINYPTLFPFETRQMFFRATAFGFSRSIVWLQGIQDANTERSRVHLTRRLDTQEFRIGRLKHERVTVPREDQLLETAIQLMNFHAERKSVLEIEFKDEEGTGLGPSLEFYALISLALQRNDLKLWVSMDDMQNDERIGPEYSRHNNGLFPAPFPQDSPDMTRICQLFAFLGIFLAKCLQDNRLVDIPLSSPFFKMLCAGKGKYAKLSRTMSQNSDAIGQGQFSDDESVDDVFDVTESTEKMDSHYFSDVITDHDFEQIHPNKAKFIKQLTLYVEKRQKILCDTELDESKRRTMLDELPFVTESGVECKLEDLGLTFQYVPSSTVYGFDAVDLKPNGANETLTGENVEEYIELLKDFTMHKGIAMQLEAFRSGFNRVFPMERLHAFKPNEVRLMLCGEQAPQWTYEELMMYTEPKYGYHKDSPGFLRLINVLVAMDGQERKEFLQFATGCSSLPPGGISNLLPRLTVVKKESEGDGSYPSVNTCVHYLKLPEYSSEEILKEKLRAATREKGFHLN